MKHYEPLAFGPTWMQTAARAGAGLAIAAAFLGAGLTAGPGNWQPLAQARAAAVQSIDPPQVVIVAKRERVAQADGSMLLAGNDAVECAANTHAAASGAGGSEGNLQP